MKVLLTNKRGGSLIKTVHQDHDVFAVSGQGLYAWVTESQFNLMKFDGKDPIKFGQYGTDAKDGSKPQDTISNYSWVTESVVILWAHRLTQRELEFGSAKKIEKLMQNHIGPRKDDGNSTEVFFTSIDKIKSVFSEIVYNTKAKQVYPPRLRQQEAIDAMINYFKLGGKEFLLNAIMRFGKNFTFLTAAKQLVGRGGNILILTNKPGVFDSLEEDIRSHVYFKDWQYVKLKNVKDKVNIKLDPNKITVIAVSKQLADNKVSGKYVRKFLAKTKFDIAMFDECHSGTNTKTFEDLEKIMDIKYKVFASGTPFKTIVHRAFTKNNTYYYGYIEQQNDKRSGIWPDAVTLENYVVSVDNEFTHNPNFTEEESFTLTKLFAVNNEGNFIFAGEVRDFIKDILGISDKKAKYSPYRFCEGDLSHTIWLVPSEVKVAEALAKMIEEVTSDYKVLVASGNNVTEIKEVHDAIIMNKKTITLTNMRFIEGTTVPEWNGAFLLCDEGTAEKYFQFIFRTTSQHKQDHLKKDKAFVFDFSPERSFKMILELSNAQASQVDSTDSQAIIKEWFDNYNFYRAGSGPGYTKILVDDAINILRTESFREATLKSNKNKYIDDKKLLALSDIFAKLNIKNNVDKELLLHTHDMGGGKNYSVTRSNQSKKELESTIELAKKTIASIVANLPLLSDLYDVKTAEELYQQCDEDVFYDKTGAKKQVFGEILKVVDTKFINFYL